MFTAKLIGEADGHVVSKEFAEESAAIRWTQSAGLRDFDDQTARAEVWSATGIVWTRSGLQGVDQQDRQARRDAVRLLAKLNLSDKGRR
jgi:hypothetical protein